MLYIALLDDDQVALGISKTVLESFFTQKGIEFKLDCFSSPLSFLSNAKEVEYELVILDIDMPEMDGIEVAKRVRDIKFDATIIFLSQKENLVFDCFSVRPFGFIRKNKLYEDFAKIMNLYLSNANNLDERGGSLTIKSKAGILNLKIRDIVYIEGNRNYQSIHLKNEECVDIRMLLSELEEKLSSQGFLRIQKGFLVNSFYIRRIEKKEVVLTNGYMLPISSKRREEIMEEYLKITRKQDNIFLS
ncbi:MAG: LytTR family DNA-binding domain-containing protein [Bacillota bacterium]|nr:LytTR family DNA-binding domain-containing protein [Bacillota bacterium]